MEASPAPAPPVRVWSFGDEQEGQPQAAVDRLPPSRGKRNSEYSKMDKAILFLLVPALHCLLVYNVIQQAVVVRGLHGDLKPLVSGMPPQQPMAGEELQEQTIACNTGIEVEVVFLILYLTACSWNIINCSIGHYFSYEAYFFRNKKQTGGHGPGSVIAFRLVTAVLQVFLKYKLPLVKSIVSIVQIFRVVLWNNLGFYWGLVSQAWGATVVFNVLLYDMVITKLVFYHVSCPWAFNSFLTAGEQGDLTCDLTVIDHQYSGTILAMQRAVISALVTGILPLWIFLTNTLSMTWPRIVGTLPMLFGAVSCAYLVVLVASYAHHVIHNHYVSQGDFCGHPLLLLSFFTGCCFFLTAVAFLVNTSAVWNIPGRLLQFLMRPFPSAPLTASGDNEPKHIHSDRRLGHINWRNFLYCTYMDVYFDSLPAPEDDPRVVLMHVDNLAYKPDIVHIFFQDPEMPSDVAARFPTVTTIGIIAAAVLSAVLLLSALLWVVMIAMMMEHGLVSTAMGTGAWPWQLRVGTGYSCLAVVLAVVLANTVHRGRVLIRRYKAKTRLNDQQVISERSCEADEGTIELKAPNGLVVEF
uniref:Uncharacterized protein n=1 Tax=Tetraselmis chuii TaxID=63592 RepID=A0A7S1XA22_9CHLO|mmetsp:Transcript_6664/g.12042  ORF Transcript_6664/g.12042 Transcript_6664/m.12042 type:complete len:581 (+) Transcript_6664:349-2091(+)|eukprot:CAMPEP_0177752408 /NCGR_PEP_ID=MMETSP0491_2-20121128/906_1 /TAXON_ID=63592 /ORGANISM="Tetraselmis chuii, Strain PLY429" /LENGTH=580 /DNA_ID=CAMNT_0019267615 /DNA_START=348 /DNA_END=2090 /DNA_ORIENTATION=-